MGLPHRFFGLSLATALSRVSGFGRDIVLFGTLGTSTASAAFLFAFTLPHLLRRLLGEGALASALIPIFSQEMHREGRKSAFRLLQQVFSWATLILTGLLLLGAALFWGLGHIPSLEEHQALGFRLAMLLLPFALFICLTALVTAALNVLGHFFLAATPAIWLNLSLISSLLVSNAFGWKAHTKVYVLSAAVLLGGLIPLLLLMGQLRQQGWRWRWDFRPSLALAELKSLFLPGLLGAAVVQLNLAASRFLAFSLQANSIALLYLAERLIDLPLGIFVIALTSLFFPQMARSSATRCDEDFWQAARCGLIGVLLISVPAALGLGLLGREIIQTLFVWGQFQAGDALSALPVLRIFSLALPFCALSSFLTRIHHAKKDMRVPLRASACAFGINLSLSLLLLNSFQVRGMAWAHVLAVFFQTGYLASHLRPLGFPPQRLARPIGGILLSSAGMGGLLLFFQRNGLFADNLSRMQHAGRLFSLILIGILVYCALLSLWNFRWLRILLRRQRQGLRH
ncbi:MAG: murein biosynthesis integral membrane protein MurJ [Puniceicoccales bacterium]|jgi:putative peptidoglycan lipid II flippase|nr:murein biosynthesis integral membrane protein MurJ [Puniceicoccales bacterium]